MDGHVEAARQVGNGFALVSTGGVGNIPVLHENRQIGVTGSSGYLLVPNLNPYGNNQISIATEDLAVDARVPVININVVPQHLAGVLAAKTELPVLAVPMPSKHLQGLDSLLAMVQMPGGIPVATFAIGEAGAANAGLFAVAMLAGQDPQLADRLKAFRAEQRDSVLAMSLPEVA